MESRHVVYNDQRQFAEVTVDIETGIVKVTRVLVLQDCGLVVSRLTAESQCYGGVVGSLNFALFEDRILDRNTGQMVNPNMEWYLLAGMSDIPRIDVRIKDQPERRPLRRARARLGPERVGGGDCACSPECDRCDHAEPAADTRKDSGRDAARESVSPVRNREVM